jgi:hypothetical protein
MAATSEDLMRAVLALDAYNRGYSPGMTLPNQASIGTSSVLTDSSKLIGPAANDAGFYAVAYQWDGEIVVSYRGTRFDGVLGPAWNDIVNGWTLSFGYAQASQGQYALQFYDDVLQKIGGDVVLTGHSLGGALAGFVADVSGAQADVFNNMAFGSAVVAEAADHAESQGQSIYNAFSYVPSSSSNVRQFIVSGEIATADRALNPAISASLFAAQTLDPTWAALAAGYGASLDQSTVSQTYSSYADNSDASTLHNMALAVLMTYADANELTDWESIGQQLYDAEFNDSNAAQDLGITNAVIQGWYSPAQAALSAVAYSAAPGGSPFGSTATQSYFADADTLGKLVSNDQLTSYLSSSQAQDDLVEILVQYAEDQAWTAGNNGGADGQADGAGDFVANGGTLTINLDPQKWVTTFQQQAPTIVGLSDLASTVVGEDEFAYLLGGVYSSLEQAPNDLTSAIEDNTITQISAGVGDLGGILDGSKAAKDHNGDPGGNLIIGEALRRIEPPAGSHRTSRIRWSYEFISSGRSLCRPRFRTGRLAIQEAA